MEIGKKVYNEDTKKWEWVYTSEERKILREQMMAKKHTILQVVKEERKGNYIFVTYNNGLVEKKKYHEPSSDSICMIVGKNPSSFIPFNPNRGYDEDLFNWGDRHEN